MDQAVYNNPINAVSLLAQDSPSLGIEYLPLSLRDRPPPASALIEPNRTSTERRSLDAVDGTPSQSQKRQPRKLTKTRGNSDSASERPPSIGKPLIIDTVSSIEKTASEKPKNVLTKKAPQRQNSTVTVDDAQKAENTPYAPKE